METDDTTPQSATDTQKIRAPKFTPGHYVWSETGEYWISSIWETSEGALREAREELADREPPVSIKLGRIGPPVDVVGAITLTLGASELEERAEEVLCDAHGTEDNVIDGLDGMWKTLSERLAEVVRKWAPEFEVEANWFSVRDVIDVTLDTPHTRGSE